MHGSQETNQKKGSPMLKIDSKFSSRGKSRRTTQGRTPWKTARAMVEILEVRTLLSYAAPVSYPIGTTNDGFVPNAAPVNVITADFNGDGKLDLVVAHTSDNSIYVMLGNGNGTFQPAVKTAVGEAIQGGLRVGDFNNDGKLDLFLPSMASGYPAVVMLGNGDGTFKPALNSSSFSVSGTYPRGWAVGDFNGDGKLDVVASLPSTSANTGGYDILLGNGDGTFKAGVATTGVLGYSRWVTTGDFNGDGKLDLAFADGQQINGSAGNAELSIALGNGDGTFKPPVHYASPGLPSSDNLNPEDVVVGDVNGDGKLDAIVSNYDDNINVYLGNGDGTFKPAVGYAPGQYPRDVVIKDVNGDGKADLVVSNLGIGAGGAEFAAEGYQPGSVAVMLGNGTGTFGAPTQYQPFDYPGWTAVGDFNGDGSPDLAVSQVFDGHSVAVMLNSPTSTNLPPTVATNAAATPSPVTGKTATLSVVGADDGGESNLTYTWGTTVTPPGAVAFSINGTNAAKNTTVTFTKAGTYYFKVTITDAAGLSAIDMVPVTVSSTLSSISISPASASVATTLTNQFTASALDQFGAALSTQPAITWTVSGGGVISSTGLFTAGATPGGPFTVTAASGAAKGTASVTVTGAFVWTGAGITSDWSELANWNTKTVPGAGATVIFNATSSKNATVDAAFAGTVSVMQIASGYAGTVSLSRNLTLTGSFNESAGTFSEGASTLFVAGDFTENGGTFNAGTGNVTMNGTAASQNISATGVNFNNFTLANGAYSLNVTGTLTTNGTFTWLRTAGWILGPNGSGNAAIECRGDIDDQNHGNTGSPYFTLDGTTNQTIKDTSGVLNWNGYPGGDFRGVIINKASGAVILACDPLVYNGLSLLKGSVISGNYWWFVDNEPVSTATGLNLGNVTLASNVAAGEFATGLQVANLNLNGHTLVAPSTLYVSGNWNAGVSGSVFTANGGTVIFDGGSGIQQLTSGGQSFNNLTITAGSTVQVMDSLTVTGVLTNLGTLIPATSPTVTGVNPNVGPTSGGTQVTITGTNFLGTTQVHFGSVSATSFVVNSNTSITAVAPAQTAGAVNITVYNATTSAISSSDIYTYQASSTTDTWTGLGTTNNWSEAANWSANAAPSAGTTVLFNATSSKNAIVDAAFAGTVNILQIASGYAGTVSLSRNLTLTGSFTESAGTFSEGASTLLVAGDLTENGGTFNAGTGNVTMNGTAAAQNISATGTSFNNFTLANGAYSLNVTGTLTVNGTFTWLRTAGWILGPGGSGNAAIECRGDVDDQNHGNTGSPYFTFDGTTNQTIKDTSGVLNYNGLPGGDFRGVIINKTSGAVILACDPVVYNSLSLLKGSVISGSYWWNVDNEPISAAAGLNLGNLTLASNIAAGQWSAGLQVANLNLNGHTLVAPSLLYVSGNLNAGVSGSVLTANNGTVVFDGTGAQQQLTSGGNKFYNVSILSGAVVQLEDDLTVLGTFTNNGTLDKNGHKLNGV
jgi:hypothetical protein